MKSDNSMITTSQFNLRIEKIKVDQKFDTYLESIGYFIEHESDQEPERIAKHLNKKIIEELYKEANELGLLKHQETIVQLL